jgi:hypothetical protein
MSLALVVPAGAAQATAAAITAGRAGAARVATDAVRAGSGAAVTALTAAVTYHAVRADGPGAASAPVTTGGPRWPPSPLAPPLPAVPAVPPLPPAPPPGGVMPRCHCRPRRRHCGYRSRCRRCRPDPGATRVPHAANGPGRAVTAGRAGMTRPAHGPGAPAPRLTPAPPAPPGTTMASSEQDRRRPAPGHRPHRSRPRPAREDGRTGRAGPTDAAAGCPTARAASRPDGRCPAND